MSNGTILTQLKAEKDNLDPSFVHCARLLNDEIEKTEKGFKYTELHNEKRIKLIQKVLIPVKEHPKVNFVGKLLGPQGQTLKALQAETGTKMSILGKGSVKDKRKEEELRTSTDSKYQHLNEELHVLIESFCGPQEAHARMGHALTEVQKYLHPDFNEDMNPNMQYMNGAGARGRGGPAGRGRGGPPPLGAAGLLATPGRGAPRGGRGAPPARGSRGGRGAPGRGAPRGGMGRAAPISEDPYAAGYEDEYYRSTASAYESAPARPAAGYEEDAAYYGEYPEAERAAYESYETADYQGRSAYKSAPTRAAPAYRARPY